ncbi:hypothetical protein [Neomoorella thermoacetica]|uniref:hypothetical protein n=1 Tax=Neomoorella thermoacetica TaxID=1525 RepID=UPI00091DED30|nr:hypothetical protein [Moorella thermoacetica]OIQ12642.1 hypothetical protein MOOTH_00230 [Moorella thermoacetica]
MDRGTLLLALLTYGAVTFFLVAVIWRIRHWVRMPRSFPLTLFPAAPNRGRVSGRVFRELLTMRSLWSGSKEGWAAAWSFHVLLALALLGHATGIATLGLQHALQGTETQETVSKGWYFRATPVRSSPIAMASRV